MPSRGDRPSASISRRSPGRRSISRACAIVAGTTSMHALGASAVRPSASKIHLGNQVEDRRRQRICLAHEDPAVAVPFAGHADLPVAAERLQRGAERLVRALLDLLQGTLIETDAEAARFLHPDDDLADL